MLALHVVCFAADAVDRDIAVISIFTARFMDSRVFISVQVSGFLIITACFLSEGDLLNSVTPGESGTSGV